MQLRVPSRNTGPKPGSGFFMHDSHPGTCQRKIGEEICGAPFRGPASRRYCDQHSKNIQYRGRSHADQT